MFKFLNDNLLVMFVGHVLKQSVGISMGTICDPILAEWSLYLNEESRRDSIVVGFITTYATSAYHQ